MKKQWKTNLLTTGLMMALSISLLAGVNSNEAYASTSSRQNSSETVGSILLSADPEIKISYNKRGSVTTANGLNKDGRDLLKNAPDYTGKSCETVVADLIGRMDDGGYLDAATNDRGKNIIIKLSGNSQTPDDDFLDDITNAARGKLSDRRLDLRVTIVDSDDYEQNYTDQEYINYETVKKIVKDQLQRNDITFLENDYDIDDGVYELEFLADGVKYECDINASTGKVTKMEQDNDDRYDNRDDDRDNDRDDDHDDDRDNDRDHDYDDDRDDDRDDDHDDDHDDSRDHDDGRDDDD